MLRRDLPPLPRRLIGRPIDHRGFPVPWFVTQKTDDGRWNFVVLDRAQILRAQRLRLCWICGQQLGRFGTFVVGPITGITMAAGEPPAHLDCATFAAKACPFLVNPSMRRNDVQRGDANESFGGVPLEHNPGVIALWSCTKWQVQRAHVGHIFRLPKPTSLSFWAEGRRASPAEIERSIHLGLPKIIEIAAEEGAGSLRDLATACQAYRNLLPPDVAIELEKYDAFREEIT